MSNEKVLPYGFANKAEVDFHAYLAACFLRLSQTKDNLSCINSGEKTFEININKQRDDGLFITLTKKDGSICDVSQFVADGYKIIEDGEFYCCNVSKIISYNHEHINHRQFLLNLFHEIGHSYQSWHDLVSFKAATVRDTDAEDRQRARNEREAWVYSLKKMRQLEREGYDVFSGFVDEREVREYIKCCLESYELCRMEARFLKQRTITQSDEKTIYVKRFKGG